MATHADKISIDPSSLTTQMVLREIASLKELLQQDIEGIKKSIQVAHDDLVRVPTDVQKQVATLKDLHEEKFRCVDEKFISIATLRQEKFDHVQTQFKERDIRAEQSALQVKTAVDAAFAASKEAVAEQNKSAATAVAKAEATTIKQIESLQALIQSTYSGLDGKISDLKDRLNRIEGKAEHGVETKSDKQVDRGFTMSMATFALGILALIASVAIGLLR